MRRIFLLIMVLIPVFGFSADDTPYAEKRAQMVELIEVRGVKDEQTLKAMSTVPRHEFVPERWRSQSYNDYPLPIGHDQTISQPYVVAFMTEQLQLDGDEKVLEIGTGSGYQAAILAQLADSVFTIEIIDSLSVHAQSVIKKLEYNNVFFRIGDGYDGWPKHAPYDCIIVTAAPDHVPQPLLDQLKNGGRMVIPLGSFWQKLVLITKDDAGQIQQKDILPVRFVPMTGKAQQDSN